MHISYVLYSLKSSQKSTTRVYLSLKTVIKKNISSLDITMDYLGMTCRDS